jgi:DNA-binding transcriptional regulator PaaX
MIKNKQRMGTIKKKVLNLLLAGLALGLTRSYKKQKWILKQIPKEFEKINRQALKRAVNSLYTSRLIEEKHHRDGTTTIILSENGKKKALSFDLDNIKINTAKKWDSKWRIVMFDIPEKLKKVRESLRFHFKTMGLLEFQKSVFISPYPCDKEVEFTLEFYNARKYVRFILAESIDNELHFKNKFGLY